LPFDQAALGALSRRLAEAVFASVPALRHYALIVKSGEANGLSLVLDVPSPTQDTDRRFVIWADEKATPNIGFGPIHTHETTDEAGIAAIVDRAIAILEDRLLIIEDVGGAHPGHGDWLDLREPDALLDRLTCP